MSTIAGKDGTTLYKGCGNGPRRWKTLRNLSTAVAARLFTGAFQ